MNNIQYYYRMKVPEYLSGRRTEAEVADRVLVIATAGSPARPSQKIALSHCNNKKIINGNFLCSIYIKVINSSQFIVAQRCSTHAGSM